VWIKKQATSQGSYPGWLYIALDCSLASFTSEVSDFINAEVNNIMERMEITTILHVVFDRYFTISTKSGCRTSQLKGLSCLYKLTEESPLPKQVIVLNVSANKKSFK